MANEKAAREEATKDKNRPKSKKGKGQGKSSQPKTGGKRKEPAMDSEVEDGVEELYGVREGAGDTHNVEDNDFEEKRPRDSIQYNLESSQKYSQKIPKNPHKKLSKCFT